MNTNYQMVPPDGGWGYVITASVTVMSLVSIVPQTAFGLIFGNFLASIGDETTGTTIINGVFNTVQSFTGLAASFLLQRYSYRMVGLLGAILFSTGAFAIIFANDLTQMIICFGILEGLGYGLMTPASFSAFNCYFDRKLNFMMSIAQTVMVLAAVVFPPAMAFLIQYCGFRGTVIVLGLLSILNFPAMGVLHPVKWYMKKVPIGNSNNDSIGDRTLEIKSKSLNEEFFKDQTKSYVLITSEEEPFTNHSNKLTVNSLFNEKEQEDLMLKPRFSVISLGDRSASVPVLSGTANQRKISSSTCMDMSLLKDLKYLNISFGVALSFTSDTAFIAIIPLILNTTGLGKTDIGFLMMVYFGSDLISRITISVISALCKIRNRRVFLAGSFLSAIFRIAFVMNEAYIWKLITLAALGFLRCLIQTPLPLVFSDEYSDNFPTAFSLYMAVCGFVSIIVGLLMSTVKTLTQNDIMVVHVLTGAFLTTSVFWIVELTWDEMKRRRK